MFYRDKKVVGVFVRFRAPLQNRAVERARGTSEDLAMLAGRWIFFLLMSSQ
jgi:hypothetical protein